MHSATIVILVPLLILPEMIGFLFCSLGLFVHIVGQKQYGACDDQSAVAKMESQSFSLFGCLPRSDIDNI
ncbi:hypothetical protein KC328_g94 [Hortaea werneckii]|nr:hypothetical protein KC328_g94 [Hortaea werneckii]